MGIVVKQKDNTRIETRIIEPQKGHQGISPLLDLSGSVLVHVLLYESRASAELLVSQRTVPTERGDMILRPSPSFALLSVHVILRCLWMRVRDFLYATLEYSLTEMFF